MAAVSNQPNYGSPLAGRSLWRWLALPLSLLAALAGWEALVRLNHFPAFILPLPGQVWQRFLDVLSSGDLAWHASITLGEVLGGLGLGLVTATALGYLIAKSPGLERALTPYIVASQAVPIVAIAPLLVIWFGAGLQSKVLICALIVFFPILINTVVGLRSIEPDLHELMRSLRATRWQMFIKLDVPGALPVWLGGLKVGATLSVIGAVVGEFVGADRGLGFLINFARGQYDMPLVFVGVTALVAIALALYGLVSLAERWLLAWKQ